MGRVEVDPRLELQALILEKSKAHDFPLIGMIDLELGLPALAPHLDRYDHWLERGNHGAMEYLKRGRDRRADPRRVFPETKSLISVAVPYTRKPVGSSPEEGVRYARYIDGSDYHRTLPARLEKLMEDVRGESEHFRWKLCVDTSAVLERSWAALAGLGWIGKNTLLIHPKQGSYLFIGTVLFNQELGKGPSPLPDYCGHCTRCLDGCPTGALVEPHWLDSNRCVGYWTVEKRGSLELAEPERLKVSNWVAGCDICQEVCPFNEKPARLDPASPESGAASLSDWISLLSETEQQYRVRVQGSSMSRVKPAMFSRNLALAFAASVAVMTDAMIASCAPLVRDRFESEKDLDARVEWERCVRAITEWKSS